MIVKAQGTSTISDVEDALDVGNPSRVNDDGPIRHLGPETRLRIAGLRIDSHREASELERG